MDKAKNKMREARISDITDFVRANIDQPSVNLRSLNRMSNQDLHLLASAIDNGGQHDPR